MRVIRTVIMSNILMNLSAILLCIVFFIGCSFKQTQYGTSYCNTCRTLISLTRLISPPKDYYDLIVDDQIDITQKGLIKRYTFQNKYWGGYRAGIFLDMLNQKSMYGLLYKRSKLKVEVNFYVDDILLPVNIVFPYVDDPFISGELNSGYFFLKYYVPDELPADKIIVCEIKIIEPDDGLLKKYGPVRFFIQKDSDE